MYLPAASCTPSFCQDTLKNQGLQPSPEYCEGVALALTRKVCASNTAGRHRQHHVREDDAGHEVDAVLLEQPLDQLLAGVGILLIVGQHQLHRQTAELASVLLQEQS